MGDLTTKQAAAIAALLEGNTKTAAATAAGVTMRTLQRWLNEPAFTAELRAGSDGAIRAAVARLSAAADASIEAIENVRDTPTTPGAAVKLRAADALLNHALRIREHADILERLSELERRLNENQ
jgi:hypothetical protein